jgi:TatD DNase family protein
MLADSHCHLDLLDLSAYPDGLNGVLAAARAQAVTRFLCVSINLEHYPRMRALVEHHQAVSVSVGVHPNERGGYEPTADELVALAVGDGAVAIGETGLDYFRSEGDLDWQRERFRTHIRAARSAGKPLIVHSRDAPDDTLAILREEGAGEAGGVMHCFTGDWEMARKAMDLGFHISFSGIVTFKTAQGLMEVARRMPLNRMLVETDCPYLAPVPYRGKPNQPAYVRHVAEHIARLRGESFEHIAEATTRNFLTLFNPPLAA